MVREDLISKSVPELRQMCTTRNILGVSNANQDTLINAILDHDGGGATVNTTSGGMIQVSSGASSNRFPVAGRSVQQVRTQLQEVLNIDSLSQAIVNGDVEDSNYILQSGDTLEFIKQAGKKG